MITLDQFADILGDSLFAGDIGIAGIVIFAVTMAVVFTLMKQNVFGSLVIAIPTAFIFSAMGILSADMMVILIVVCVLGLATVSKKTLGD